MSLFKMFGSLLLPIFPLNWLLALNQVPKLFASLINSFKGLGNVAGDIMNDLGRLALGIAAGFAWRLVNATGPHWSFNQGTDRFGT